jgi:RNA polymerase sigma factor (sigma-70 family)
MAVKMGRGQNLEKVPSSLTGHKALVDLLEIGNFSPFLMTLKKSNELAASYVPFARACAMRLAARLPQFDADDLTSDAMLCLVRASRKFDPKVGVSFATYARKFLWFHLLNKLRKRNLPTISTEAPDQDTGESIGDTLIDDGPSPYEEVEGREQVSLATRHVVVGVPTDAPAKARENNRLASKLNIGRAEASRRMRKVRTLDSKLGASRENLPIRRGRIRPCALPRRGGTND